MERTQFGISDPEVPAFGLVDEARDHTLLIKFETFRLKNDLRECRCPLIPGQFLTEASRVSRRLLFVRRSHDERYKEQVFA